MGRGRIGRRDKIEGKERGGRGEGWKVVFWNVVRMGNKDGEFWERLREWDVLVLWETWMDKKGWVKVREKLRRGYE